MRDETADARILAANALTLLESGRVDQLRTLLLSIAGPRGEGASWSESDLAIAAARCSIGASHVSHPLFDWAGIAGVSATAAAFSPMSAALVGAAIPLTGLVLGEVGKWITSNVDDLRLARRCMVDGAVIASPKSIEWRDSPSRLFAVEDDGQDAAYRSQLGVGLWLRSLLANQAAVHSTNERATMRIIYWAREAGLTQRDVADSLQRPQTYVFRQLQTIDADPGIMAMSPRELHDHYRAGHIDRAQLLALLAAYPYEGGSYPEEAPDWGYIPGGYDQLVQLTAEGYLSHEELDVVLTGVEAMASQHG